MITHLDIIQDIATFQYSDQTALKKYIFVFCCNLLEMADNKKKLRFPEMFLNYVKKTTQKHAIT